MRFTLGATLLESFDAAFVRASQRHGHSLRKEVVAGVTGGDLDQVGFAAEADNILDENNFSFWHKIKMLKWDVVVFRAGTFGIRRSGWLGGRGRGV